jgi:hypothetical protein
MTTDERDMFAKFRAVQVKQHRAMPNFLFRHLLEDLCRRGIMRSQAFGETAVNSAILLLVGNGEREDFLLIEIGEPLHSCPQMNQIGLRTIRLLAVQTV